MKSKDIHIIATLGPATKTEEDVRILKAKGVSFVRVNMSHSSLEELEYFIGLAKKVDIPFILDTQGSQVRTGDLVEDKVEFEEHDRVLLYKDEIQGDRTKVTLTPKEIFPQLEVGDVVYVDFNSLVLRITDVSTSDQGYIVSHVINPGHLGKNKGCVIDPGRARRFTLPTLSEKDYQAIEIGLREDLGYIAASFMRSGQAVEEVRRLTKNKMKIISKVECIDALENLDDVIAASDYILIDRGDLSKEIPIEKIPFTQKIILQKAQEHFTGVFVATNLLETMVREKKPTRAEVHDVIATIRDGAIGLTMSAETAIGKYPMEAIDTLQKLIRHAQLAMPKSLMAKTKDEVVKELEDSDYLLDMDISSSLVEPHGGKLVDRVLKESPSQEVLQEMPQIALSQNKQMDLEQIAIGTYSPIEGFMGKADFESVIDTQHLKNGILWPIPIYLDVSEEIAASLETGKDVALTDSEGGVMGILHLEEKYQIDVEHTVRELFGTSSSEHPGVTGIRNMGKVLLGGKISLIKRRSSDTKEYELTPRQTRRLFEERGWSRVLAFHTRNVIHRSHEFIQLEAMKRTQCDGLLAHPVVGKKKKGDFNAEFIIRAYERMSKDFYPKGKALFGTFVTYSRYAGPKEALFTALCRKNFGCSHIVIGRDHTGVKDFYHPKASHKIFDQFPGAGIIPVRFDKVFYSKSLERHIHEPDEPDHSEEDKLHISGTQARKLFEAGEKPPGWFMREEIAEIVVEAIREGKEVFVKE